MSPYGLYKLENQPIIHWHTCISDRTQDLGPKDQFETAWPLRENDQASTHPGPKGFHMAFDSWKSAQESPKIWFIQNGGYNLHTCKSSSNKLKNKFPVNLAETFVQNKWKPEFWFIWPYLQLKKTQKYGSMGLFPTHYESNSNELKKIHVNQAETFCKIDKILSFDLIWAIFRGPKIWPQSPYVIHAWKYSWYMPVNQISWSHVLKPFWENGQKNPLKIPVLTYFW